MGTYPQDLFEALRQAQWKIPYLVPWSMCENEKKAWKKFDIFICSFCQWKVHINFGLTMKGWRRLLYYSWQLAKDIMLLVFILAPRKGLFVINFVPFTQGPWMVFVCHEKQPSGCVPGVAHGEANDKSTIKLVSICNKRLCCLETERK